MMKRVVQQFGPDLCGLRQKVPGVELLLNARRHTISVVGDKELKQIIEKIVFDLGQISEAQSLKNEEDDDDDDDSSCPICLCEVEDSYMLENCHHKFCRVCLFEQCESAMRSHDCFPLVCAKERCGARILLADLRCLLPKEKMEELFRASLGAYVEGSGGTYKFCPSPDCPSVYKVADPSGEGEGFICGACFAETCSKCHTEYHPYISCEKYREFEADPDASLKEWCVGKENVKKCPNCGFTVEKVEGCNHVACRCGEHVCWVCLASFQSWDDCYAHLRSLHQNV